MSYHADDRSMETGGLKSSYKPGYIKQKVGLI
jgi:hypothetical protein